MLGVVLTVPMVVVVGVVYNTDVSLRDEGESLRIGLVSVTHLYPFFIVFAGELVVVVTHWHCPCYTSLLYGPWYTHNKWFSPVTNR